MKYFNEKIAYLRGLCHGSGFDETTKEGKIFDGILDVLDDMADIISALDDNDYTSEEEEEEDENIDYTYAFICPNCGEEVEVTEDMLNGDAEILCPKCNSSIEIVDDEIDDMV